MTALTVAYYIKLINGEEIVSQIHTVNDGKIILNNPLQIENLTGDDGNIMVIMSRFAPFVDRNEPIAIPLQSTVIYQKASELMQTYYEVTLDICRNKLDRAFDQGVTECVKHMIKVLRDEPEIESEDGLVQINKRLLN